MPKSNRHGQAAILSDEQFYQILEELSPSMRRLFLICGYTGCRISEALQLTGEDIGRDLITFRKSTTKTKETRQVPIHPKLQAVLGDAPKSGYLFPGRKGGHLTRQSADLALRKVCVYLGIAGVSTHSFRRSALTKLSNAGVPLRVVQEISGHRQLSALQKYLEVNEEQVVAAIGML